MFSAVTVFGVLVTVRILALVVLVALAVAVGLVLRRRDGRLRTVTDGDVLDAEALGGPLGERATFVQFSSPACTPCRAVRRVLTGLVTDEPGLGHVEIDATERLDLARRLDVMRTPTVFVLDPGGRVVGRLSGPFDATQARAALPVGSLS